VPEDPAAGVIITVLELRESPERVGFIEKHETVRV